MPWVKLCDNCHAINGRYDAVCSGCGELLPGDAEWREDQLPPSDAGTPPEVVPDESPVDSPAGAESAERAVESESAEQAVESESAEPSADLGGPMRDGPGLPLTSATTKVRPAVRGAAREDAVPVAGPRGIESDRVRGTAVTPLYDQLPGSLLLGRYRVVRTLRGHSLSDAGVYVCEDTTGDRGTVVLKVMAAGLAPRAEGIWSRLPTFVHPNILRTHEVTTDDAGRQYEIQEYCAGGNLASLIGREPLDADWLCSTLVPQLVDALHYLHEVAETAHRDVKPENVLFDASVAPGVLPGVSKLGDFDISSELAPTGSERFTASLQGTWLYVAPECLPEYSSLMGDSHQMVATYGDYYSLGVTLLYAAFGTTTLHLMWDGKVDDSREIAAFYREGKRVEVPPVLPDKVTPTPVRLRQLLFGLLARDPLDRWGYEQVRRWEQGESTAEDLAAAERDAQYTLPGSLAPFQYRDIKAGSADGLARALLQNRDDGVLAVRGGQVAGWIAQQSPDTAQGITDDVRSFADADPGLMLYAVGLRLHPALGILTASDELVDSPAQWRARIERANPGDREMLASPRSLELLAVWLERRLPPRREQARMMRGLAQQAPGSVQGEDVLWTLDLDAPFRIRAGREVLTAIEFSSAAIGEGEDWGEDVEPADYAAALESWQSGRLERWLAIRGYGDLAAEAARLREAQPPDPRMAFDNLIRTMNPALPSALVVLDVSGVPSPLVVAPGTSVAFDLPYSTLGPGVPRGVLVIEGDSGVTVADPLVTARAGVATVTVNAPIGLAHGGEHRFRVGLNSTGARLQNPAATVFSYSVAVPEDRAFRFVFGGAAAGALLLGLTRLVVAIMSGRGPFNPFGDADMGAIADVGNGELFGLGFLVGLVLLAISAYLAYRLAMRAWARGD